MAKCLNKKEIKMVDPELGKRLKEAFPEVKTSVLFNVKNPDVNEIKNETIGPGRPTGSGNNSYGLQKYYQHGRYRHYAFTVPTRIAKEIPPNMLFSCELTEEGILYKPIIAPTKPTWMRE